MKKVAIALAEPDEPRRPKQPEKRNSIAEWAVTLLMMLFATATVAQPFVVPSGSMEDTIMTGDHVIADRLTYAPAGSIAKYLLPYSEVRRGDIIVFHFPLDIGTYYVKRVIGVPGDHIRIVAKQLYLNGKPVAEPYTVHKMAAFDDYRDYFPSEPNVVLPPRALQMLRENVVDGELVVPPDNYFALGDNRDNSSDSRYWGLVPRVNVVGKPVLIYWSFDAPTAQLEDGNLNLDHLKDIALNFFTKTRWNRTFHLVRGYPLE